jgi:hypothetical protein
MLADGQTGTGKTHTMTGDLGEDLGHAAGVIPRAIHQIFAYLDGLASEYTVKCSYLELYNEEITDLLAVGAEVPKVRACCGGIPAAAVPRASKRERQLAIQHQRQQLTPAQQLACCLAKVNLRCKPPV